MEIRTRSRKKLPAATARVFNRIIASAPSFARENGLKAMNNLLQPQ
jgi:hypothetical protein